MVNENMHIHSKYSWDSKMEINEIAKILVENNIRYAAITDHVEFNRESLLWILINLKIRNLEIEEINKQYDGKLTLLKAVEISEPHLYKEKVEALTELGLDFIMGSIHDIDKTAKTVLEKELAFIKYYKELLKMVESKQINVVGHLDYIYKYYDRDYSNIHQVSEIMEAIKDNNQIIEINTSALRRKGTNVFPDIAKIGLYKLRQDDIMIGTDAHRYSELTDNLEQANLIINELNLRPVIYQKRKRIII